MESFSFDFGIALSETLVRKIFPYKIQNCYRFFQMSSLKIVRLYYFCISRLTISNFHCILYIKFVYRGLLKEDFIMNEQLAKELVLKYPDKILQPFDTLFDEMGYEAVCAVSKLYGGSTLYIPTTRRIFSKCFAEEIRKEFDGVNIKDLSRKYSFCERSIRYILSDYKPSK